MGTESKLDEVRGKVEVDFANIYDANKFKQEMEDRFEGDISTRVSSNFKIQESFKKIYESSQDEEQILAASKVRQEELKEKLQQLMEEYSDVVEYKFDYYSSDNPYDCDEKDFALDFVDTPEAQKIKRDRWQRQQAEKEQQFKENNWTSAEEVESAAKEIVLKNDFEISDPTGKHPDRKMHFHNCGIAAVKDYRGKPHWEIRFEQELEWPDNKEFYKIIKRPRQDAEIYYTYTDNLKSGPKERKVTVYGSIPFGKNEIGELKYE